MRLDSSIGDTAGEIVALDDLELFGLDARKRSSEGVDLVPVEECALELVEDDFQDLLIRALCVIFSILDLVGNEAKVPTDKLGN